MFRIDGPGATPDNKFTKGDPAGGVQATTVTDEWLNAVQEELAAAIEGAGIPLVKGDVNQLADAIAARAAQVFSPSTGAGIVGFKQAGAGGMASTVAGKLNQIVTPMDYGGSNDGADDTTPVTRTAQRATSAKVPALIPRNTKHGYAIVGTERIPTVYSFNSEVDFLGKFAYNLYRGIAVVIDCYGDSTYVGADPALGLGTTAVPAPMQLQNVLRDYYRNTSATVNNRAISGTNSTQMLAGTDGSGQTFEARVAANAGTHVIFCNHCINDVQLDTPADVYKSNLIKIVEIVRKYGKTIVLETPNPYYAWASYGNGFRNAEGVKLFAGIMRQVAREMGVPLVDNYSLCEAYIAAGNGAGVFIPDGVHPTAFGYKFKGTNMAQVLIAPEVINLDSQYIMSSSPAICDSNAGAVFVSASVSKSGYYRQVAGSNSLRVAFLVTKPGYDLYVAHPVWSSGSNGVVVKLDAVDTGARLNQYHPGVTDSAHIGIDYETVVVEQLQPGFHTISLEWPADNGLGQNGGGINYFRLRQTKLGVTTRGSFNGASQPNPNDNRRKLLWDKQELVGNGVAGNFGIVLFDDTCYSNNLRTLEFEFSAALNKGEFLVLGGWTSGPASGAGNVMARPGVLVGLDTTSGKLTVYEDNGAVSGAFLSTVGQGATDLSGVSHTYYISWRPNGTIAVYVDSANVGTYTLSYPWRGGRLGIAKDNTVGGAMAITKLYELQRF
jgi:lysophospholipase L1-like esterase